MSPASAAGGEVLLVGAGRMGGALLKGWLAGGRFSAIRVIEPNPSSELRDLAASKRIVLEQHFTAAPKLAAIVLAMKPQVIKAEPGLLPELGQAGALVVSIAAGIGTGLLGSLLGASRIARAMPNTPGAIGKGITALYGGPSLSTADRDLAEHLMSGLGDTLWVADESLMDVVTAVSGSGPAYLFLMAEVLAAAGRAQGLDPASADRLARATVSGAGALLAADPRAASELRKEVTSPGGTTEAALKVLVGEGGLDALMAKAVDAATRRGRELGAPSEKPKG